MHAKPGQTKGLTFIEVLIVLSIIGIITIIATPSYVNMTQSSHLKRAAESLRNAIYYAQSQATKTNSIVYLAWQTGTNWCYGINANSACTCSINGSCQLASTNGSEFNKVSLTTSQFSSTNVSFDAIKGLPSAAGTFTVSNSNASINVILNIAGQVRICSNSNISGYKACS